MIRVFVELNDAFNFNPIEEGSIKNIKEILCTYARKIDNGNSRKQKKTGLKDAKEKKIFKSGIKRFERQKTKKKH